MTYFSRRELLGGAAGAAVLSIGTARADEHKPALRAAHITDVHITPARDAPKGVAAMFNHMFARTDWKPDLVLDTGDTVMAVDGGVTGASAVEQIDLWKAATKACPAPIYACLGNHDVWGGNAPVDRATADQKGFALMVEALGMPASYYSFDKGGWHFIALNSMSNWPHYGALSIEHFDWLKDDLAKTASTTPVCVLSHLPIVSITALLYGDETRKGNNNVVPGVWQHADCWAISEVFRHHPNVKLCLSGHMHTWDRCEYRGVWYICGGAVSGAWWGGAEYGFPPCYGKLDLFPDGTFHYDFVDYAWPVRGWSGKKLKV